MSAAEERRTEGDEPTTPRDLSRAAKLIRGLYQQIAAVFAAFGLAALVGHLWGVGWRGFLEIVVQIWYDTVRPVMTWVFDTLVSTPLRLLGIDFEVPQPLRDYVAVGVILALSHARSAYSPRNIADSDLASYVFQVPKQDRRPRRSLTRLLPWLKSAKPTARRSVGNRFASWPMSGTGAYVVLAWPIALPHMCLTLASMYKKGVRWIDQNPHQLRYGVGFANEDFTAVFPNLRNSLKDLEAEADARQSRLLKELEILVARAQVALLYTLSPILYLSMILGINFMLV